MDRQHWLFAAAALFALAGIACGFADARRRHRRDLDRMGIVDWPTVQVVMWIAAAVIGVIGYNS